MTIDDLLAAAETIKNENGVGKNTSTRVGALLSNMINHFATNISPETQSLIDEAVKKYTSGVRKGMTVQFDPGLPLPAGFVFANGNGGVKINGVTIPDWRGRVPVGFDPLSALIPANADKSVKNYGKVGNTGGVTGIKLTGKQSGLKKHKHRIIDIESDNSGSSKNALKVENTDHINGVQVYTAESGYEDAEESFDNRMEYGVAYWITKFSDDYTAEYNSAWHSYLDTTTDNPKLTEAEWVAAMKGDDGRGIVSNDLISGNGTAGTTDTYRITYTDGSHTDYTVVNGANGNPGTPGSSTETAPYNLSGLDADIEIGTKASHTMLEAHSFTAADIYLESTAAPTDFAIEVDVKKNGVSIFSTKPKINAGSLHLTAAPVLVATPTVFAVGDIRTVSVESIGTTETGKNLVLSILMHK